MARQEQERVDHRSIVWIARHIDLRYEPDRELLQIIEKQPVHVWQGSARALAARWEAQRRGLIAPDPQPSEESDGSLVVQAPKPRPRHRYVRQPEPDPLLLRLLLDDPGEPDLPAGSGD